MGEIPLACSLRVLCPGCEQRNALVNWSHVLRRPLAGLGWSWLCSHSSWELTSLQDEATVQQTQVAGAQLAWDAPLCPSMEANLFHAQLSKAV